MEVFLEDIHEAVASGTRAKNQFLRERGWVEERNQFKKGLVWGKTIDYNGLNIPATQLTTDEAIDAEIIYNKINLHKEQL